MQAGGRGKPLATLNCKVVLLNSGKLSDPPSERSLVPSPEDTRGVIDVKVKP